MNSFDHMERITTQKEIARLRADLAAERLVAKNNLDWFNALKTDYDASRANVAKLRERLNATREVINGVQTHLYVDDYDEWALTETWENNLPEEMDAIDAVLEETGGTE